MYEIVCVVEDTAAEDVLSRCLLSLLGDLDEFVYLSARMCEMFSSSKFNSRMGILN